MNIRISIFAVAGFCLLVGCKRDRVHSYEIPKEESPGEASTSLVTVRAATDPAESVLRWEIPEDWVEAPDTSGMRLASYETPAGADFSIVQLPDSDDLSNVNRWLRQLGRPPIDAGDLPPLMEEAGTGGFHIHLFTLEAEPGVDRALLAAIYRQGGQATFFKLDGSRQAIAAGRDSFIGVLRSLETGPSSPVRTAPTPTPSVPDAPVPNDSDTSGNMQVLPGMQDQVNQIADASWTAPGDWEPIPGSPIRKATYRVGGEAEMAITAFPGDVGGLSANVNRWRRQLGLSPAGEAEIQAALQILEVDGYPAHLVRLSSAPADGSAEAVLGLIVAAPDSTWFFKMTGPAAVLEQQEDALLRFAETIEFSN